MAGYKDYEKDLADFEARKAQLVGPGAEKLLSGERFHSRRTEGPTAYMAPAELSYNPYASGKPYGLEHGLDVPVENAQNIVQHVQQQARGSRERMADLAYRVASDRAKQLGPAPTYEPNFWEDNLKPFVTDPVAVGTTLLNPTGLLGTGMGFGALNKLKFW